MIQANQMTIQCPPKKRMLRILIVFSFVVVMQLLVFMFVFLSVIFSSPGQKNRQTGHQTSRQTSSMGPNHFSNHINVIRCFDKFVFNFTRLDQNLIFLPTDFTLWWNKSKQLQPKTIHHLSVKLFFQTSNQIWHSGGVTWLKCCEKRPFWSLTHLPSEKW